VGGRKGSDSRGCAEAGRFLDGDKDDAPPCDGGPWRLGGRDCVRDEGRKPAETRSGKEGHAPPGRTQGQRLADATQLANADGIRASQSPSKSSTTDTYALSMRYHA
jgi:hypothetical protein